LKGLNFEPLSLDSVVKWWICEFEKCEFVMWYVSIVAFVVYFRKMVSTALS